MEIIKETDISVSDIVQVLKKGGLVIMPTETMYGAMVDATNQDAVLKLTQYKNRPFGKPYSIAVTGIEMARQYADINTAAEKIYKNFLPGPVTVISTAIKPNPTSCDAAKDKPVRVYDKYLAFGVASEKNTIGIRIPDYKLVIDVVKELGRPITATSANASYKRRPYCIQDILNNLSKKQIGLIDLIVDAGELPHREPSTVIDTTLEDMVTLRQGEIEFNSHNTVISRSEEDTKNLGKELWQKYEINTGQRAIVFALEGPMGAGKTQFTKGLAEAMGIEEEVVSPTFNLENRYKLSAPSSQLSHIDAWRMENDEELIELGFDELITDKSVIAIEWADRVSEIIRKYNEEAVVIWVNFAYGLNEYERIVKWGTF